VNYDDYHNLPGVRASRLKLMDISPMHYRYAEDKDTYGRGVLRAIHCLALEPEKFDDDFAIFDLAETRRAKTYDGWALQQGARTCLTRSEATTARAAAASMMRHPEARKLLTTLGGASEETIEWVDAETGIPCKARLDRRIPGAIIDLKTYGTAIPHIISRMIVKNGAHIQAAHYHSGWLTLTGEDARYLIISAEGKGVCDVGVVDLTAGNAMALGQAKYRALMARLRECLDTDTWPGACPDVVPCELPDWSAGDLDTSELPEE
jgi:PDDEXK-like domain of unknown function (DUF3799)